MLKKYQKSNKISFGEKYYKYFIAYLYKDYKVKPLHLMFMLKFVIDRLNGSIFWLKMITY